VLSDEDYIKEMEAPAEEPVAETEEAPAEAPAEGEAAESGAETLEPGVTETEEGCRRPNRPRKR